jgi:hypothetical protein
MRKMIGTGARSYPLISASGEGCQSRTIALLVVAGLFVLTPIAGANLASNPGFETGDFSAWTTHICASCFGTGWFIDTQFQHSGTYDAAARCGGAACLDPVSGTWLSQVIPTIPGQMYSLTFWLNAGYTGDGSLSELDVWWNGIKDAIVNAPFMDVPVTMTQLRATSSATTLEFVGEHTSALWIDDIDVETSGPSAIPEPLTMRLVGGGLALILAVAKKRRSVNPSPKLLD